MAVRLWKVATGTLSQLGSANLWGAADPRLDQVADPDFQRGRTVGDVLGTLQGGMEIAQSLTQLQAEGVIAGIGLATTPEGAGILILAADGTLLLVSMAEFVHGGGVFLSSVANLTGTSPGVPGRGTSGGARSGKRFTKKGKGEIDASNADRNGGANVCESCEVPVVPAQQSTRGVTPPKNERHRDHIVPRSKGGDGEPSNGQVQYLSC